MTGWCVGSLQSGLNGAMISAWSSKAIVAGFPVTGYMIDRSVGSGYTNMFCSVLQVKGVMRENVHKVMERGDHLGRLEGKAGRYIWS